ncbi:hypothetical protein ABZX40_07040 [Streptomyces sp. NPDC004610]|uniref:hypothetical protein n=1 Tax=unclassified Streptomyces TaxID=2593676 RepID=UPI0033A1F412
MAADAARDLGQPAPAKIQVTENTYRRWLAGTHVARGGPRQILEHYFKEHHFKKDVHAPRQIVPAREIVRPRPPDGRPRTLARQLDYSWPTSRHIPGDPDAEIPGTWDLAGGARWQGTSIGLHIYEAHPAEGTAAITRADLPHLDGFVRFSRRGVILAFLGAHGGSDLYALDSAHARRDLATGQDPRIPPAYRLDDLTCAFAWALHVLDDGLLADDGPLSEQAGDLPHYVELSSPLHNPAPPLSGMPDLSPVGAARLGSSLCPRYITRHLGHRSETPAFWTGEASGEECAPWLLFAHQHAYLEDIAARFASPGGRTGSCFDNAAAESFRAVLKEDVGTRFWPDRAAARADIFDFIETFHNRRRLRKHIHWGYLTPHETRLRHRQDQALAAYQHRVQDHGEASVS